MASESRAGVPRYDAMAPIAVGPLVRLAAGDLQVDLAPQAGGRIAQIRVDGIEQLIGPESGRLDAIQWGCYPMLPWAGRIREGRFPFAGRDWQLPINMPPHALHGLGYALPWTLDASADDSAELSLHLPQDPGWPFGGIARERITLRDRQLHLHLSLQAGEQAMPAVIGWHPWFRKPDQLIFDAPQYYPRDAHGMARLPLAPPPLHPWDDCFLGPAEVVLVRGNQRLQLTSDQQHWVVYDAPAHATCVEPQTGPPDAFNLTPHVLAPGEVLAMEFLFDWRQPGSSADS